jgi:hypothetical protein
MHDSRIISWLNSKRVIAGKKRACRMLVQKDFPPGISVLGHSAHDRRDAERLRVFRIDRELDRPFSNECGQGFPAEFEPGTVVSNLARPPFGPWSPNCCEEVQ